MYFLVLGNHPRSPRPKMYRLQQPRSDGSVGAHVLDVLVVVLGRALKVAHLGVDVRDGAVRVRVALKPKKAVPGHSKFPA